MVSMLLFLFIMAPVSLFLHELGHCLAAYIRGSEKIRLQMGLGKTLFHLSNNRFSLHISAFYMIGSYAVYERKPDYTNIEKIFLSLGGPLLNLFVTLILFLLFTDEQIHLINLTMLFNGWLAIVNVLPFKLGKKRSDGYVCLQSIWNMIKSRNV